mmetsp:Transcript_12402/g.19369  ORF Transcript_12402/g.19369 Transcript_12402/m.19369 type:complete len:101 (+) Transcript_12402:1252-1554(+)
MNVEKESYETIGRSLILALESVLKEDFTGSVKSSWVTFFLIISSHMISDNYEQEEGIDEFTPLKIKLVQNSWKAATQHEFAGLTLFRAFFELDPDSIETF